MRKIRVPACNTRWTRVTTVAGVPAQPAVYFRRASCPLPGSARQTGLCKRIRSRHHRSASFAQLAMQHATGRVPHARERLNIVKWATVEARGATAPGEQQSDAGQDKSCDPSGKRLCTQSLVGHESWTEKANIDATTPGNPLPPAAGKPRLNAATAPEAWRTARAVPLWGHPASDSLATRVE